jgi:hypothetical protein
MRMFIQDLVRRGEVSQMEDLVLSNQHEQKVDKIAVVEGFEVGEATITKMANILRRISLQTATQMVILDVKVLPLTAHLYKAHHTAISTQFPPREVAGAIHARNRYQTLHRIHAFQMAGKVNTCLHRYRLLTCMTTHNLCSQ